MSGEQPAIATDVLTAREAAEWLRIPVRSFYEYAARGDLPGVVRIGRHLRVSRAALERLISPQEPRP